MDERLVLDTPARRGPTVSEWRPYAITIIHPPGDTPQVRLSVIADDDSAAADPVTVVWDGQEGGTMARQINRGVFATRQSPQTLAQALLEKAVTDGKLDAGTVQGAAP